MESNRGPDVQLPAQPPGEPALASATCGWKQEPVHLTMRRERAARAPGVVREPRGPDKGCLGSRRSTALLPTR